MVADLVAASVEALFVLSFEGEHDGAKSNPLSSPTVDESVDPIKGGRPIIQDWEVVLSITYNKLLYSATDNNHLPFSGLQQFMLHLHSLMHFNPFLKQRKRFVLHARGTQLHFPLLCGLA